MNKISIKNLIIERLSEIGIGMLDAFLPKKYPETYLARWLFGLEKENKISKQRISNILSKLQKEGLVSRNGPKKKSNWQITTKGKEWIKNNKINFQKIDKPKPDGISRIVIFDIEEKERKKRAWLRRELISFDYNAIQKSVWLGETPLSKEFIKEIDEKGLGKCVHIFSIKEKGTIKTKSKMID